jgi:hypothetical protein
VTARRAIGSILAAACAGLVLAAVTLAAPAENPAIAAFRKTNAARSTIGTIAAVTTAPGLGRVTFTGTVEAKGADAHVLLHSAGGSAGFDVEAVLVNGGGAVDTYLRSQLFRSLLPVGKPWLHLDLQGEGAKLGIDFSSLLNSPTQSPELLAEGLVRSVKVGTETVAGRPAVHYRLTIDYDRAVRRAPRLRATVERLEKLAGLTSLRTNEDVWVGADGRVRRIRLAIPTLVAGTHATISETITYSAFDVPVRIVAPAASLVASVPKLS